MNFCGKKKFIKLSHVLQYFTRTSEYMLYVLHDHRSTDFSLAP